MLSMNDLERQYYESTVLRYQGGKSAVGVTLSQGMTTVITPAVGKSVAIYWVYALTDPDSDLSPLITVKVGNKTLYVGYAISHWEVFKGSVNETVTVTVSEPATVAVTIHYEEF